MWLSSAEMVIEEIGEEGTIGGTAEVVVGSIATTTGVATGATATVTMTEDEMIVDEMTSAEGKTYVAVMTSVVEAVIGLPWEEGIEGDLLVETEVVRLDTVAAADIEAEAGPVRDPRPCAVVVVGDTIDRGPHQCVEAADTMTVIGDMMDIVMVAVMMGAVEVQRGIAVNGTCTVVIEAIAPEGLWSKGKFGG